MQKFTYKAIINNIRQSILYHNQKGDNNRIDGM